MTFVESVVSIVLCIHQIDSIDSVFHVRADASEQGNAGPNHRGHAANAGGLRGFRRRAQPGGFSGVRVLPSSDQGLSVRGVPRQHHALGHVPYHGQLCSRRATSRCPGGYAVPPGPPQVLLQYICDIKCYNT